MITYKANVSPHQLSRKPLETKNDEQLLKSKFTYISSGSDINIKWSNGNLMAARRSINQSYITTLESSFAALNKKAWKTGYSKHTGDRGSFKVRHYEVWADYRAEPGLSAEYVKDLPSSQTFLTANAALWEEVHRILKDTSKAWYTQVTQHTPLPKGLQPLAGPFCGIALNTMAETGKHKDSANNKDVPDFLIPFSDRTGFTGGELILWDAKMIVQVTPGEVLMMPGALCTHSNQPFKGVRNSLDLHTHQSVLAWWKDEHLRKRAQMAPRHMSEEDTKKLKKLKDKEEKRILRNKKAKVHRAEKAKEKKNVKDKKSEKGSKTARK